jgi:HlyD family secretion protein
VPSLRRSIAALFLVALMSGCSGQNNRPAPQPAPANPTSTPAGNSSPHVQLQGSVRAAGKVVPAQKSDLALAAVGRVDQVLVAEGAQVPSGAPLLLLDSNSAAADLERARSGLKRAQAALAQVKAGARPEEVAAAQAAYDAAQAKVVQARQPATAEDLAAAQAAVAAARAALRKTQQAPDPNSISAAAADLANAQAAVRQAQAAYDQVRGNPDIALRPEALRLEQTTNELEAAKSRYKLAAESPSEADIAQATATLARSSATLAGMQPAGRQSEVIQAEAAARQAQAQLDLVKAGARPEAVAAAEADVATAQATVKQAEAALQALTLAAPFAGTITTLNVSAGEVSQPAQPVLTLADLSRLRVESTDLSERDVARVAVGRSANVTIEPLGVDVEGKVVQIASQANVVGGDAVYRVVIELAQQPAGIRWGMTAQVDIADR